jgi:hypothetical protein
MRVYGIDANCILDPNERISRVAVLAGRTSPKLILDCVRSLALDHAADHQQPLTPPESCYPDRHILEVILWMCLVFGKAMRVAHWTAQDYLSTDNKDVGASLLHGN